MARHRGASEPQPSVPEISVAPSVLELATSVQLSCWGWDDCPIAVTVAERAVAIVHVIQGERHGKLIQPVDGRCTAVLDLRGVEPGRHEVVARSARHDDQRATAVLEILDTPDVGDDGRPTVRWLRRQLDFLERRFPGGGSRPGSRLLALAHRDLLRAGEDETGPPVLPGANWYPIGPSVVIDGQVFGSTPTTFVTAPISGRVVDIAIDPNNTSTVYAATAQGGLWRSRNDGLDWEPLSDFAQSLACGSVTIDPSMTLADGRSGRLLVGTGEPNASDSYYGVGMLETTDGGTTWTTHGATTFVRAAFSSIEVDPADNQHLIAATDIGVYESTTGGVNWTLVDAGASFDLAVDWGNAGGAEVYVARTGVGVRRRVGTGAWTTLGGGLPATVSARLALAMAPSSHDTLYAAIPVGSTVDFYKTTDGGTTWTKSAASVTGASQLKYNLALGVHPTDPTIVVFGEVHLWRTTNSGGAWTRVSTGSPGIHADQHAVCFHPTDGTKVFVGNDGGIWHSTDTAVTWTHRNKDLATLQYFGVGSHGQYEGIMLGGTQDNGAQRYASHPAWWHSALGDGAFCAIDGTANQYRWFETRWYPFPCFRSDTAGAPGSWVAKQSGITTNSSWFYPPFQADPNDSTVLYVGYTSLYRSTNSGDSWTDVSGTISAGSNVTAIAVAPSDSTVVYVGLQNGRVFRLKRTGTTWTTTDVSAAPIPAGQISDIAVHPTDSNTLYVTTSDLIFGEGSESFAADHVYRTTNGGTNWASVSTGLSQANPVNCVAIDPMNPQTLFIGCDVGIFRTTNGGTSWSTWDSGLPNCSVQDLAVVPGQRLLRAATHGRSVWERPIDAATTPAVQLYVRDNLLDTGRTTPSPSGLSHPFTPGDWVYWWQSGDVKIDSPDPATNTYEFAGLDIDYLRFEKHQHDNPRRSTWVRVYTQVHARGNASATNVKVKAFWADASGFLPNLPTDFWTAFPNSDPTDTSHWHPLGPAHTIPSIAVGRPQVSGWSWLVPSSAADHTCMLLVATCDEDAISVTTLDVATAVNSSNHVALRNLHVDPLVPGATGTETSSLPIVVLLGQLEQRLPMDVRFNVRGLEPGSTIQCVLPPFERTQGSQTLRGFKASDSVPKRLRDLPVNPCRDPIPFDFDRSFSLTVAEGATARGRRDAPGFNGVVPAGDAFAVAFIVTTPRKRASATGYLHVEQWMAGRLVGGCSYELRSQPASVRTARGRSRPS